VFATQASTYNTYRGDPALPRIPRLSTNPHFVTKGVSVSLGPLEHDIGLEDVVGLLWQLRERVINLCRPTQGGGSC